MVSRPHTDFDDLYQVLREHKASVQTPFCFAADIHHLDRIEADVALIDARHFPEPLLAIEWFVSYRPSIPIIVIGILPDDAAPYLSYGPVAVFDTHPSVDELSAEIRRSMVASRWLEGSCLQFWSMQAENNPHSIHTSWSLLKSMPIAYNFAREQGVIKHKNITELDLSHTDLSRAQIYDLPMARTNFAQSTAVFFNAQRAQLMGSDFSDVLFIGSNFSYANLTGCQFRGAEFVACRFTGAQLNGADLVDSYLVQCLLDPHTLEHRIA
ncbi:MAG: pentapeptide repeat-containing protein [Myxococcales bacterium]|nr:pentapeptide repeat-containing protein [Myxococcales bacterium]